MAVTTSLSAHDDTSEVSDLRARIEQQLIAAAKSGRGVILTDEDVATHS